MHNTATLYGRNEWEQNASNPSAGVPAARTNLMAMNHSICAKNTPLGWTKADILADLGACTAFYVNTRRDRSGPYPIMSDKDEIAPPDEWVYPAEVDPVRVGTVGTGYPPFNTGSPPLHLAFTDARWTGLDNLWAQAILFPECTAYNQNWCGNQCEVGWPIETKIAATSATGAVFWSALAAGATAHEARDAASNASWYVIGENPQNHAPRDTVSLWGDSDTRLDGLYTGGDHFAAGIWHD